MKNSKLIQAILALGIISFLGIIVETALNITFSDLMNQFGVSSGTVQWLTSGYMLVSTIIIPFGAFFRRRFKLIDLFRFGVGSFLLGTILALSATSFEMLLAGRQIQGIANGLVLPLMFSVIISQAPKNRLGTFMGLGSLVLAFAPAVGPIYGGIVAQSFNWRYIFTILIPIIIVAYVLGEVSLKQDVAVEKTAFDFRGGVILAITLLTGLLLINSISTKGYPIFIKFILGIVVVLFGWLFIRYEKRQEVPLLNLDVFKEPSFMKFLVPFFLLQLASLSMSYLIPNVLQMGLNQTTAASGILIAPAAIIDAIVSIIGGIMYDRLRPSIPIIGGALWILITFVVMSFLNPSVLLLAIGYASFMIGLGLSYSNIMTNSLSKLPSKLRNDGNAVYMTAQAYAGAVGIALSASVMGFSQGQKSSIALGALQGYMLNILILIAIGIIILLFLSSLRRSNDKSI